MALKQLLTAVSLVAGLSLGSLAHGATIVSDGDFSSPIVGSYITYYAPSGFGDWKVTSGSVDLIGNYWQSPTTNGGSVDLDGNDPGAISQTLTLTPGATYTLTFDLSGNPDGGNATKSVDVTVGNLNDLLTYTTGTNSHGDMNYTLETLTFTAGNTNTLSFTSEDNSGSAYGAVIGNVSVSPVPEPTTWALMLMGFGMIGYALRNRSRFLKSTSFA